MEEEKGTSVSLEHLAAEGDASLREMSAEERRKLTESEAVAEEWDDSANRMAEKIKKEQGRKTICS